MLNKKAISPVVATALLLVVAVLAVTGFQGWFSEFSSSTFSNVEQQTQNSKDLELKLINEFLYISSSSSQIIDININNDKCLKNLSIQKGLNKINVNTCIIKSNTSTLDITTSGQLGFKSNYFPKKESNFKDSSLITAGLDISDNANDRFIGIIAKSFSKNQIEIKTTNNRLVPITDYFNYTDWDNWVIFNSPEPESLIKDLSLSFKNGQLARDRPGVILMSLMESGNLYLKFPNPSYLVGAANLDDTSNWTNWSQIDTNNQTVKFAEIAVSDTQEASDRFVGMIVTNTDNNSIQFKSTIDRYQSISALTDQNVWSNWTSFQTPEPNKKIIDVDVSIHNTENSNERMGVLLSVTLEDGTVYLRSPTGRFASLFALHNSTYWDSWQLLSTPNIKSINYNIFNTRDATPDFQVIISGKSKSEEIMIRTTNTRGTEVDEMAKDIYYGNWTNFGNPINNTNNKISDYVVKLANTQENSDRPGAILIVSMQNGDLYQRHTVDRLHSIGSLDETPSWTNWELLE